MSIFLLNCIEVSKEKRLSRSIHFYSNEKLQKKCVNPLDFNLLESHVLLVHSTFPNCRFR